MKKNEKVAKMRHTYQERVSLSEDTIKKINFLSQAMICLWNLGVTQAEKWLEENKTKGCDEKKIYPSEFTFNYWLTDIRQTTFQVGDQTIHWQEISCNVCRELLRKLAGSYKSFLELKKKNDWAAKKPSLKDLGQFQTLSWALPKVTPHQEVVVAKGNGENILIPLPRYIQKQVEGRDIVHVTISRRDGHYFLSVVVAEPAPKIIEQPRFFRAIDLGAGDIAVSDSDGTEFLVPMRRSDKYWKTKIICVESRQKQCIKGSRAWHRRAKARQNMHRKGENQRTSYQRKLADALVEEKIECIILSKPKTRLGLAKSEGTAKQHTGVQNTGYMFRLLTFIKEKAVERGVEVIEIADPRREGDLEDPQVKLVASRKILAKGMGGSDIRVPADFIQKKFFFKQS